MHRYSDSNDAGINIILKGLQKDPKSASMYYMLGYFYMEKGDHANAALNFRKCIEIDDKYSEALLGISIIYYYENDKVNAKKYLDLAKAAEPLLNKGMDGIIELEGAGLIYPDKKKETLRKMFDELK